MSKLVVTHTDDDTETIKDTTITNPSYVDVLVNVAQVAVDGRVFSGVQEVEYVED